MADGITHARHAKRTATLITAGAIAVATVQLVGKLLRSRFGSPRPH